MRVFVINMRNEPLMPCSSKKARVLLKQGKAKVVKREPFTIKLLIATGEAKQEISFGVDAGSKMVGLSATTEKQELFSAEVQLRNDIAKLLVTRRQNRRTKRNRLRYRKPRFLNRVKSKHKGWLAPSIEHKIQTHLTAIKNVYKILPISKIIVETAQFDVQKIKNPDISGKEYQKGEQLDFYNVKEYVLFRDTRTCQYCGGKSKDKKLEVHHIVFRSEGGGNSPDNLITLCKTCHKKLHNNEIKLKVKKRKSFKDAAFMGIMRPTLLKRLNEIYPNVQETYGYITKNTRIKNGLQKEHRIDALCISGNLGAERVKSWYFYKKVRRHNRQIHKAKILKGGKKKLNQASYIVHGFRLFDKVLFEGSEYFIFSRRVSGSFVLRTLEKNNIQIERTFRKLKLIKKRNGLLVERR